MNDAFKSLDREKQNRILDAGFQEFAEKGYKQASTNQIAKAAGIGKGTLFYYFKNKQSLFHDLIEEAFNIADETYLSQINFEETDFFERLRESSELKMEVYRKQEHALTFMAQVFMHMNEYKLPERLLEKRKQAEEIWGSVLTKNIDFSKFRDDIPQEKTFNYIRWTIEGYRMELEQRIKLQGLSALSNVKLEPYYEEFYDHLDTLKMIYYKEEFR
ncbi:MAG: TetR/AcrR family transcriptional regulator [Alkalibacterium sp.]|nr:TetR/AcrR family transcriptional regulator [Alkalibacterium sp.]TVP90557.1 MAG: TetR/AcrR family transcriptional regulator [Alkalibacterium sp.]